MISIILPVYNGENTIKQQLDALASQMYDESWELIVVDNGSKDQTANIVNQYQTKIPSLRIVTATQKQNSAYARNVGAQEAKGESFLFCDADDIVNDGWLEAMASAVKKHDFVAGAIDTNRLNNKPEWRQDFQNYPFEKALDFLPYVSSCNMAVSRKAFERVQGFDETFCNSHDLELSWRLQVNGFEIYFQPEAVVFRRYRATLYGLVGRIARYATFYPLLYKLYREHGMPASPLSKGLKRYKWIVRHINYPFSSSEKKKIMWARRSGYAWGLLKGTLKFKTIYL